MDPSPADIEVPESDAPLLEPDVPEATTEAARTEVSSLPAGPFSSLYQTFSGTLTAVALGIIIIVGTQFIVACIKDISLMCFSYYFGSKTIKEPKETAT